jgi:hypothetical protein
LHSAFLFLRWFPKISGRLIDRPVLNKACVALLRWLYLIRTAAELLLVDIVAGRRAIGKIGVFDGIESIKKGPPEWAAQSRGGTNFRAAGMPAE